MSKNKPSNRASFNVPISDHQRFGELPKSFPMGRMVSSIIERMEIPKEKDQPMKNVCLTLTDEAVRSLDGVPFGKRSEILRQAYNAVLNRWESERS